MNAMQKFATNDLKDLGKFRPTNLLVTGILFSIPGLIMAAFAIFFLYILARLLLLRATISSPALSFLIFAACLVGFGGLAYILLTVAVGRIRGSFQRDCHFRAGSEVIDYKFPRQRRFRLPDIAVGQITWSDLDRITNYERRSNYGSTKGLYLFLKSGERLAIDTSVFEMDTVRVEVELNNLAAGRIVNSGSLRRS